MTHFLIITRKQNMWHIAVNKGDTTIIESIFVSENTLQAYIIAAGYIEFWGEHIQIHLKSQQVWRTLAMEAVAFFKQVAGI